VIVLSSGRAGGLNLFKQVDGMKNELMVKTKCPELMSTESQMQNELNSS